GEIMTVKITLTKNPISTALSGRLHDGMLAPTRSKPNQECPHAALFRAPDPCGPPPMAPRGARGALRVGEGRPVEAGEPRGPRPGGWGCHAVRVAGDLPLPGRPVSREAAGATAGVT